MTTCIPASRRGAISERDRDAAARPWLAGVLVALAWCAAPISPVLAQQSAAAGATTLPPSSIAPAPKSATTPDPNAPAHVHVHLGRTFWPGHSQPGIGYAHWDLAVDGGQRIPLPLKRPLEFDLHAGNHRFTRYLGNVPNGYPVSIDLAVAPGEDVWLALNLYSKNSPTQQRIKVTAIVLTGVLPSLLVNMASNTTAHREETIPEGLDHPQGFWLAREPPPAEEAPSPPAH